MYRVDREKKKEEERERKREKSVDDVGRSICSPSKVQMYKSLTMFLTCLDL